MFFSCVSFWYRSKRRIIFLFDTSSPSSPKRATISKSFWTFFNFSLPSFLRFFIPFYIDARIETGRNAFEHEIQEIFFFSRISVNSIVYRQGFSQLQRIVRIDVVPSCSIQVRIDYSLILYNALSNAHHVFIFKIFIPYVHIHHFIPCDSNLFPISFFHLTVYTHI